VLCYGLLVRLALLIFAAIRLRGESQRSRFDHADANSLYRRLTGPLFQAEESPEGLVIPASAETPRLHPGGSAFALLSSDTEIDEGVISAYLQQHFQWKLTSVQKFEIDRPRGNHEVFAAVKDRAAEIDAIPVIVRARRPPIRAMALVLEEIRAAAGGKPELILLLLGRKNASRFAPVSPEEIEHWRNFSAINGLHIGVEAWTS
jgi:hypothetical protein